MIPKIKMDYSFDSEGWYIKNGLQNCRQVGSEDRVNQHTQ